MGVGGHRHAPAALPPGKTQHPLYRRPQSQSGQVRKISPLLEFDPRTILPVANRYTNYATPAHYIAHSEMYVHQYKNYNTMILVYSCLSSVCSWHTNICHSVACSTLHHPIQHTSHALPGWDPIRSHKIEADVCIHTPSLFIIFSGTEAQHGLWPPQHTRFLDHTQWRITVHSPLYTSDQLIAEFTLHTELKQLSTFTWNCSKMHDFRYCNF
jgi:hypothetical protein